MTEFVTNLEQLEAHIARVKAAQEAYASFSQEQVDVIFKKAALAANAARIPLAKLAVEETSMGVVEDKVIKNHFASEIIYNKYKAEKPAALSKKINPLAFKELPNRWVFWPALSPQRTPPQPPFLRHSLP